MDGHYINKQEKYKRFLADWVDNSISNKSWEKYQDLHLDEIDSEYRHKGNWIEGSFFIYEIILSIIKSDLYDKVFLSLFPGTRTFQLQTTENGCK